jgi:hypothetical protein
MFSLQAIKVRPPFTLSLPRPFFSPFPFTSRAFADRDGIVPHPLFATFELRIQTDGTITPKEALVHCCRTLVGDLEILSREFTKEYELRKMVAGDGVEDDAEGHR